MAWRHRPADHPVLLHPSSRRGRLGTSRTPVHSQWFDGDEVKFEVGTATYIVTTADQFVCVSAETLAAAFPSGYGTPVVTVRARSRVATNDDDFDSPPGGQTGGHTGMGFGAGCMAASWLTNSRF